MTDGFTLILETSTPRASLACTEPGGGCEERVFFSDRSHNAELFSPLQELLDARQAQKIRLVLVGSGPGSYSGTRVGIAAAQGVAIAAECPAVAVPSVLAGLSAAKRAACLAIGDARRGSYWTASIEQFRISTPSGSPELTDAKGLLRQVVAALAVGVPVFSSEEITRFPLPTEILAQIRAELPSAAGLWAAWQGTDAATQGKWQAELPQPIYLKPPHITPAKRSWLVKP
jgi:tRNA threonylcarbamoyladenosine biosynthesis protein TsaB